MGEYSHRWRICEYMHILKMYHQAGWDMHVNYIVAFQHEVSTDIPKTNRIHVVLGGMQTWILCPDLTAIDRILSMLNLSDAGEAWGGLVLIHEQMMNKR
jgi:hypothetical protein